MKRIIFLVAVNISVICLLIGALELTGQFVFYFVKGYPVYNSAQRRLFELHPYLVGRLQNNISVMHGNKKITSSDMHTRNTGKPLSHNTIKVAVLGGSTTFGTGLTDLDTWPALLQNALGDGYSVVNYGVPGYSTVEAIIQLALIVPEIKPDYVVMYEGWNDIRNYHEINTGSDYISHGMMQYESLQIPVWTGHTIFERLSEISSIVHFIDKMRDHQNDRRLASGGKDSREPDSYVDRIYERNLNTMKMLVKNMPAHALFVPQVLNYADFRGKKGSRVWTPHIEDDAMPELLDKFNRKMSAVCRKGDQSCTVLDEVTSQKWHADDFIDDGHFSRKGGMIFALLIAKRIKQSGGRKGITPVLHNRRKSHGLS